MAALLWRPVQVLFSVLVVVALVATACSQATPTATSTATADEPVSAPATTEPVVAPTPTATPEAATPEPVATPEAATPEPATPEPVATPEPATPEPAATPEPVEPTPTPSSSSGGSLDDALAVSALEAIVCPAEVQAAQVTCALATLPLFASDLGSGETVSVMTARVDNGDPLGIGPVVFLQGGPGVGATTIAKSFVGGSVDVIFVDQRGTGFSTPKLDCPEADANWVEQFTNDPTERLADPNSTRVEAYRSCAARLAAEGVRLSGFNTASATADLELLRQLFGYEQWSLWGSSYGTRLALAVMRDFPDGVRAAVLDSVVPFEVDFFATVPQNAFRSMAALDQACDLGECAQNHGDFLENLGALTRQVQETAAVVQVTRPVSGRSFPFRITGKELIDMVFTQLYSTSALRSLPRQVSRAEFGGLEEIAAAYVRSRDPERFDFSVALYYSTWCREEFPFFDDSIDDAFLADARSEFGNAFAASLSNDGLEQVCAIFAVPPAAAIENAVFVSDIPTIVFAGAFDPITPPQWSRQVSDALTNATFVELGDHGHGMSTRCPATIRVAFLTAPGEAVDTSCTESSPTPDFD